ncbi:hypothetical protein Tco_0732134 [Tanacetum coccineum]
MRSSKIFHQNNQYILATQATQVFYLKDLARRQLHWKVVEHVYHRDVAESDQDVIHGSSSSHVTLSVGLTCLEHTDLSINAQSTEVDAPPVNDDNANANEDNADFINNEDDVVAHVLDDDDVEVSDDDEVNPSTNVEEMACVAPRSHSGDASGSPPRRPTRPVPAQCQSSMLRLEMGNRTFRRAFRENNEQPLMIGFDYEDLGTFHPLGMLESDKGYYEDIIKNVEKGTQKESGQFKTTENEQRYAMKDNIKNGLLPFKIRSSILRKVRVTTPANMSGHGQEVTGGASISPGANVIWSYYDWDRSADVQAKGARERVNTEQVRRRGRAYLASLKG